MRRTRTDYMHTNTHNMHNVQIKTNRFANLFRLFDLIQKKNKQIYHT